MGIQGLNDILRAQCASVFTKISLPQLTGKLLALDISVYLYKYTRIYGDPGWIRGIITLLCGLKEVGIVPVSIFDGPGYPPEKEAERAKRKEEFRKTQERIKMARELLKIVEDEYLISDLKIPSLLQEKIREVYDQRKIKNKEDPTDLSVPEECKVILENLIEKLGKQTIVVGASHQRICIEILSALGMPFIQATGEAETLCSYLAVKGHLDGVITEDTDVLAYGTPLIVTKIDGYEKEAVILCYSDILNGLALSEFEFRDLCIMCGCDYNQRCKKTTKKGGLTGIGPKRAYALMIKYGSIEKIQEEELDINIKPLNHLRCRELLSIPKEYPTAIVPPHGKFLETNLEEILKKYNVHGIDIGYIRRIYSPLQMVIDK